jgi:hypothetical protein
VYWRPRQQQPTASQLLLLLAAQSKQLQGYPRSTKQQGLAMISRELQQQQQSGLSSVACGSLRSHHCSWTHTTVTLSWIHRHCTLQVQQQQQVLGLRDAVIPVMR